MRTCSHRQMPVRLLSDLGPVYSYLFGPLALEAALIIEIDSVSTAHPHSESMRGCRVQKTEGRGKVKWREHIGAVPWWVQDIIQTNFPQTLLTGFREKASWTCFCYFSPSLSFMCWRSAAYIESISYRMGHQVKVPR